MRTMEARGARCVASTTSHSPSTSASTTRWKSIGLSPGAYTEAQRAGMPAARSSVAVRWAKSRHTPRRATKVLRAESVIVLDPGT